MCVATTSRYFSIKGYSQFNLPWFRKVFGATCDIFSIDGGHDYDSVTSDLADAIALTRMGGTILADDVSSRCVSACKYTDVPHIK